jgi:PKD repeat protein
MKRLIFSALLGSIVTLSFGQGSTNLVPMKMKLPVCVGDGYSTTGVTNAINTNPVNNNGQSSSVGGSRAVTTTTIGSAGNMFTILDGAVNRVAANNAINSVVFIHRADPTIFPTTNIGQYQYDLSIDGGATWNTNFGVLNPSGNNQTTAGRYPNAVIYNPQGNTTATNAFLGYLGSWLPFAASAADWDGFFAGVARLNNVSATFTETSYTPNNSNVSIARGLCNGIPGVFWAVDWDFDGTQNGDVLLYRGVWSSSANDISWSLYRKFATPHDPTIQSVAAPTGLNMAFDPSGRYGYIVFAGDIISGGDDVLEPVYYKTNDGGATWTGPEQISLASIDIIQSNLLDPSVDIPTSAFDLDLGVDVNGNLHIAAVIGSAGGAGDYSIATGTGAGLAIYDITQGNDPCPWTAIRLSDIATFRGTWGDVNEDNRPQVSVSADGTRLTFGWLDSDATVTSGTNDQPNLLTRGVDVSTGLATVVTNWTAADPTWDGSALFASFAPTSLQSGNTTKVPTVFATLDPLTLDPENPATFHYVQNISYTTADYTEDIETPVISLNGSNPLTVVQNSAYSEPGANVTDNVGAPAVTVTGTVNTAVVGAYTVTYTVSDNAGNLACTVTRTVNVVAAPDNTAPVVTLNGPSSIVVDLCGYYNELGATATDNVDGTITANVTNDGNLVPFGTLLTAGTAGTYTITYSVTDGAGNTGTATRTIVIQDNGPVITIDGGNTLTIEVCDAYTNPGASAFDNCDGFVSVTATGTVDNLTAGNYTIIYTATDGNSNISRDTLIVTVNADQTPPSVTLTGSSTVYVYLSEPYTDQLPTGTDCSGIASITSNASTIVNVTVAGSYTVTYTVTDNNGLVTTVTRTVIVGSEPDPRFTFTNTGLTYSFTENSLYNPTAWLWEFGDGLTSTARNPSYTYAAEGTYEVCLTARNLFNNAPYSKPAKKTCQTINVTVGISNVALERSINVYPNPTTGNLTINVKDLSFETMNVKVFNMLGERVLANEYSKVQAQSLINLNIAGNAAGIYMIQISTEQGVVTKRINLQSGN